MGRELLYSFEAESAILNYLITCTNTVVAMDALGRLRADYFGDEEHRALYKLLAQVYSERGADPIFLLEKSPPEVREVAHRIMQSTSIMNSTRFDNALDALRDSFERRVILEAGQRMMDLAVAADTKRPYRRAFSLLARQDIGNETEVNSNNMSSLVDIYLKGGSSALDKVDLETGWGKFDTYVRGNFILVRKSDTPVLATASDFAINMALGYLKNEHVGAYYSLSAPKRQVFEGFLAAHAGVHKALVRTKAQDKPFQQHLGASLKFFQEVDFEIHDDKPSAAEIVNSLYRSKARRDIQFAVIDGGKSDLSELLPALKRAAVQLDIPVFLFTELKADVPREADTFLILSEKNNKQLDLHLIKNGDGASGGYLTFEVDSTSGAIHENEPAVAKAEHIR